MRRIKRISAWILTLAILLTLTVPALAASGVQNEVQGSAAYMVSAVKAPEVGSIGGVEDGVVGAGEIADPEECAKITALGIDFLAAGIGNIHGVYPANWKGLDFEALDRIHKATNNIPLVLHGGTGIPDEMIAKAISLGVSKININTECQLVFAEATRKYIEAGKDQQGKGFDPRKLLAPGAEAIKATVREKIELFGSAGIVYFAAACALSYVLSGYCGLYSSQTILYSKLRAEFINVHTKE